jgi:metal transporter CNNM
MEMKIKSKSGTEEEKIQARKVLPIITRHHLLLVSLMTWNACANEALPIFLDALVPGWLAIVLSVTIVLFVGEIIPAALLTGPNQLQLASTLAPVVYVVMFVFSPISYPISILLDYILGHQELTIYSKKELATMMTIQHEEGLHLFVFWFSHPPLCV